MAAGQIRLEPPQGGSADILFVAGEHSGDQHAALVAAAIRQSQPDWRLCAIGGPALARAGVQLLHDLTRDSVVGLVEVLRHYGEFKRLFEALLDWIAANRPRVVVLVDYPGFNLRLAEALQKRGLSRSGGGPVAVYQYVSPQVWAWKGARRFKMAKFLDELGVIFPFEVDCYRDTGLPVRFTGHPFASAGYRNPLRYDADGPLLLLPGSRKQAVARIFPVMVRAVMEYRSISAGRRCVCLYPGPEIRFVLEEVLGRLGVGSSAIALRPVEQGTTAAAVLTSSGTMSLNCALAGIPGAVVYRAHPMTAFLGRRLIRVPWLGIANLVLGRELYPEYLQGDARPDVLAKALHDAVHSPERRDTFARGAAELAEKLEGPDASSVAQRVIRLAAS